MPEGHSVHRLAKRFDQLFVGREVAASSPQGRFAGGATLVDGRWMTRAMAVGKHMFLEFDNNLWLHVHLGLYGAWDFAGDITAEALSSPSTEGTVVGEHEDSLSSIGAPRRARLRISEVETLEEDSAVFPAEPVGAVRVRLLTHATVADLRGPTACEVMRADEVQAKIATLGPDPIVDAGRKAENRFVAAVMKRAVPIGLLLMDQSVVAGKVATAFNPVRVTEGRRVAEPSPMAEHEKLWKHIESELGIKTTGLASITADVDREIAMVQHRTLLHHAA